MPDIAPWLDAAELDSQPRLLSPPVLHHPPEAERNGVEGSVTLRLHIDELGAVRAAWVISATPPDVFDRAALRDVAAARFVPAEKDFRFVRSRVPFTLDYRLKR